MHQRMIAYGWTGQIAKQIANIAGCVQDDDLFGVRLIDLDQDGQIEILAAGDGSTEQQAYKWNGEAFVFWSYVPEK